MKTVKGNLLTMFEKGDFDVIAHGCNCFHMMGAGIAGQIAVKYPQALEADRATTTKGDLLKLGSLSIAVTDHGLIYNLYSQYHPGKNLDYTALRLSLKKMALMTKGRDHKIAFPQIGCGIAGGHWNRVKQMIEKIFKGQDVTFVIYERS